MSRRFHNPAIALGALAAAVLTVDAAPAQDANMAHAHMGHVMESWKDTPKEAGLLPTAEAEAEIAAQHAGLAGQKPDNLDWMQTHTKHVLHALDPSAVSGGPGKGYGLIAALKGARNHTGLAAKTDGASKAVKAHSRHVRTALANTAGWAEQLRSLARKVGEADAAGAAAGHVAKIEKIIGWIRTGRDANGDGEVTWRQGEGGIAQARKHMELMYEAEGLAME